MAGFSYSPWPPSRFDEIAFYAYAYDPAGFEIESYAWDFGDGTTATGYSAAHQYAQDGEYVVTLMVTTSDGRQATVTESVQVDTHDVVITKFETPKPARMNQTHTIVVGLNNRIRPETVTIELYSSQMDEYPEMRDLYSLPTRWLFLPMIDGTDE